MPPHVQHGFDDHFGFRGCKVDREWESSSQTPSDTSAYLRELRGTVDDPLKQPVDLTQKPKPEPRALCLVPNSRVADVAPGFATNAKPELQPSEVDPRISSCSSSRTSAQS